MIIDNEYRWKIDEAGDKYIATMLSTPFVFRFSRGEHTPEIGCRVNVGNEVWTGECIDKPEEMPEGMSASEVAKRYARIARDAGDAFLACFKKLGE